MSGEGRARLRRRQELVQGNYITETTAPLSPGKWTVEPDTNPAGDIRDAIAADVARMARDRARQVDEWLAPQMDAIRELQASGRDVWLEETPPVLEADGEAHVYRATSTTRLRWAGDGLNERGSND